MLSRKKFNQTQHCIKKNELLAIIFGLCLIIFEMATCISLVLHAHGL